MDNIRKNACIQKQAVEEAELALINRQSLRELSADEVFVFRIAACDNQVDRDNERFTEAALARLAELYVGKTIILDHQWSAARQVARIYAAGVEQDGEVHRLVLRAYMPRSEASQSVIDAIEAGILREVSVGCAVAATRCSICGKDQNEGRCPHRPGGVYDGEVCHMDLDEPTDAYEVSFVAVPAQRDAGVIKRYHLPPEEADVPAEPDQTEAVQRARAQLALEKIRFGGN